VLASAQPQRARAEPVHDVTAAGNHAVEQCANVRIAFLHHGFQATLQAHMHDTAFVDIAARTMHVGKVHCNTVDPTIDVRKGLTNAAFYPAAITAVCLAVAALYIDAHAGGSGGREGESLSRQAVGRQRSVDAADVENFDVTV
jgi:hypothetical protein